jgi:hypothetical protein
MRQPMKYTLALVAVLALQYLSFGLHVARPGAGNIMLPLFIAAAMVIISAMVFMELRTSNTASRIVAVIAVLFVALLCFGVAGDVAFR